jgi:hypothetical protein
MSTAPASGKAPANNKAEAATPAKDSKPTVTLEEDDEFEDFPVDGMKNMLFVGLFASLSLYLLL